MIKQNSFLCDDRLPDELLIGGRLHRQPESMPGRQAVESLDRRMQKLGIVREADRLRLHRGIDRDPCLPRNAPVSYARRRLSASSSSSPMPSTSPFGLPLMTQTNT